MMNILVLNCGSSSIKYQFFNMTSEQVLAKGVVEKVGLKGSFVKHTKKDGTKVKFEGVILDHQDGIEYVLGILSSKKHGIIKNLNEIEAVGHRVTHGGEKFTKSAFITDEVIKDIEGVSDLAPLHNPANLKGIYAMKALLPGINQVAVFDTSFHQTMPDYSFMYAAPYSLYKKYGIRRYGFHGTSYRYVLNRVSEFTGDDFTKKKVIICHLGNGASLAAIKNGKTVDTSMGLTPVEGLIMGTRSGDLDLGVLLYIMENEEIGLEAGRTIINKHSGMLGITGISSDMREIEEAAKNGHKRAELALNMYNYRIRKYIGSYAAAMGGLDSIIFTGGIGENADTTRRGVVKGLEFLGVKLDESKNGGLKGIEMDISDEDARVKTFVIPTNEEIIIAQDTQSIITNK
ncbi:MAG: acetate kinase [Bacteroidales bacterium]|nr:acetate kinase [Bacteroidales bacterium]